MPIERNIKLFYFYNCFSWMIFSYPIMVLYFNQIVDSYVLAMSLFAVQTLTRACTEIPIGLVSDKVGRKKIMVFGIFAWLFSFVLYTLANNYSFLFVGSVLYGMGYAARGSNDALLYDTMRQLKRKKEFYDVFGRGKAYLQFGLAVGSLVGALFAFYSMHLTLVMTLIPLSIAAMLSLMITEPDVAEKNGLSPFSHVCVAIKNLIGNKRLRYMAMAQTFQYGLNEAAFDFKSVFIKNFVPVWSLGIFRALGHFCDSLGSYLSRFVIRKFGQDKVAIVSYLADIANVLSVLANSILTPFIRLFAPFTTGTARPAVHSIIQNELSNTERATTLSLISITSALFYSVCALVIGYVAEISSPYWALLIAYSLSVMSTGFAYLSVKSPAKEEQ